MLWHIPFINAKVNESDKSLFKIMRPQCTDIVCVSEQ